MRREWVRVCCTVILFRGEKKLLNYLVAILGGRTPNKVFVCSIPTFPSWCLHDILKLMSRDNSIWCETGLCSIFRR